jgi:hypothetical protein
MIPKRRASALENKIQDERDGTDAYGRRGELKTSKIYQRN